MQAAATEGLENHVCSRGFSGVPRTAPYAQHIKFMEDKTKPRKKGVLAVGTATVAQVLQGHPLAEEPWEPNT